MGRDAGHIEHLRQESVVLLAPPSADFVVFRPVFFHIPHAAGFPGPAFSWLRLIEGSLLELQTLNHQCVHDIDAVVIRGGKVEPPVGA